MKFTCFTLSSLAISSFLFQDAQGQTLQGSPTNVTIVDQIYTGTASSYGFAPHTSTGGKGIDCNAGDSVNGTTSLSKRTTCGGNCYQRPVFRKYSRGSWTGPFGSLSLSPLLTVLMVPLHVLLLSLNLKLYLNNGLLVSM